MATCFEIVHTRMRITKINGFARRLQRNMSNTTNPMATTETAVLQKQTNKEKEQTSNMSFVNM